MRRGALSAASVPSWDKIPILSFVQSGLRPSMTRLESCPTIRSWLTSGVGSALSPSPHPPDVASHLSSGICHLPSAICHPERSKGSNVSSGLLIRVPSVLHPWLRNPFLGCLAKAPGFPIELPVGADAPPSEQSEAIPSPEILKLLACPLIRLLIALCVSAP